MKKLFTTVLAAALLLPNTAFAAVPSSTSGIIKINGTECTYKQDGTVSIIAPNGNIYTQQDFMEYINELLKNSGCNITLPDIQTTAQAWEQTTEQITEKPTAEQTTEQTTQKPTAEQTTEQITEKPTAEQTTEQTTQKPAAEQTTEQTTQTPAVNSSMAQQILSLVNKERASAGLSPLSLSSQLNNAATLKAQDMADNGYFSHTSPTYGTPFEMLKTLGISYTHAGENIAYGQKNAEAVMTSWMNSEGHRANILNSSYGKLGVGYVVKNGTPYWVQIFTN